MLPPELPLLQEVASSVPPAGSSPLSDCLPAALAGPEGILQFQVLWPADMEEFLYLFLTRPTSQQAISEAALCDLMRQVSPPKDAARADAPIWVTLTHLLAILACFASAPSQSVSFRHRGCCALPVLSPEL